MSYWRLFYHIVIATQKREPLITPAIERELHGYLVGKCEALEAIVYAVNGVEDHVHVAASVPPKIALADFIGKIKGSASFHINHLKGREDIEFDWQRSYGIVSFGQKQLDYIIAYIRNQKEHHRNGTTVALLEHIDADDK